MFAVFLKQTYWCYFETFNKLNSKELHAKKSMDWMVSANNLDKHYMFMFKAGSSTVGKVDFGRIGKTASI